MTLTQCSYERITLLKQIWESGYWESSAFVLDNLKGYAREYLGDGWINPFPQNCEDSAYGLAKWRNYPFSCFQSTYVASARFLPLPRFLLPLLRFLTNIPWSTKQDSIALFIFEDQFKMQATMWLRMVVRLAVVF